MKIPIKPVRNRWEKWGYVVVSQAVHARLKELRTQTGYPMGKIIAMLVERAEVEGNKPRITTRRKERRRA